MKKQMKVVYLFSSLVIIALIFLSCAKENLLPKTESSHVSTAIAVKDIHENPSSIIAPGSEQLANFEMTFDELLESYDPDAHPGWDVAIKAFSCTNRGETLVAFNPTVADLDFYNSPRFSIYWFKDRGPVGNQSTYRLECACKGRFAAIVINRLTKELIGIAFHTGSACLDKEQATISENH